MPKQRPVFRDVNARVMHIDQDKIIIEIPSDHPPGAALASACGQEVKLEIDCSPIILNWESCAI